MEINSDFAYVYVDFDEAYADAGRAVAMGWSRARMLAEPEMSKNMAKAAAIEATRSKIRRVDEKRKILAEKKKKNSLYFSHNIFLMVCIYALKAKCFFHC